MSNFPIELKLDSEDLSIKLLLNGKYTFIEGDSSTGKTFIFKKLYRIVKEPVLRRDYSYNFDINKVYVCLNKSDLLDIYNMSNFIIFIDRFDFFVNEKLLKFMNSSNNLFVLNSRRYDIDIVCTPIDIFYLEYYKKGSKVYIEAKHSI